MKVHALSLLLELFLICVQRGGCNHQSSSTCSALKNVIEGRAVDRAGETCTINSDCDSFNCVGVVDEGQNPPVVADTTYTFLPCKDPPTFSVFATVTSFSDPVLDHELEYNGMVTIEFNPSFLGTINITLVSTEAGVRFGATVTEPFSQLPAGYVLFPETEIPLECTAETEIPLECTAGAPCVRQSLVVLLMASLVTLLWSMD